MTAEQHSDSAAAPTGAELTLVLVDPGFGAAGDVRRTVTPDDFGPEPWLTVIKAPPARHPQEKTAPWTYGLDHADTPFVAFVAGPIDVERLRKAVTYAKKAAAQCGLEDAAHPLPILMGWSDHDTLGAYRSWFTSRHGDQDLHAQLVDYLRLIPLRSLEATLSGLDVRQNGTVVRLTGTARRGATDTAAPEGPQLRIAFLGDAGERLLEVDLEPRLRVEGRSRRWNASIADIAIELLPLGRSQLVVEAPGPDGHDAVRKLVKASIGLMASSRPMLGDGRRFQTFAIPGSDQVQLLTQRSDTAFARLRWIASMTVRDARSFVRRRPFTWIRPMRLLTRLLVTGRPIWLVGERVDTARDNGFHLFTYLRTERPDIRAYYVIDRSAVQYARVAGLGRVVAHSSLRHRLLMLHATVLANAYSIKHMVPRQWDSRTYMRHFAWRVGSYRVYLKHGINLNTAALRRGVGGYDLYLTASQAETAASRETSGYDRQIVQTGLPRYDTLTPTGPSRTILFMPTWRLYLTAKLFSEDDGGGGDVPFEGSIYQKFVVGFLTSTRLRALLDTHDYRLQFMPHYNLREHLSDVPVAGDRVSVLDGASADIQDLMKACDVFVTDHSSVHFDLAYLGTPVVYAHFDAEDYRVGHAAATWFDHERDGFGPVTYDLDSTLDALEHYLSTGCRREDVYAERAHKAFAFHDRDNSLRAVAAIEDLVRTRGNR